MTPLTALRSVTLATLLCTSLPAVDADAAWSLRKPPFDAELVKRDIELLTLKTVKIWSEPTQRYFNFYGLDIKGAQHLFGSFASGTYVLTAHIFTPPESRGTVLVLHGYYDHAGTLKHLIEKLLQENYTVAVYDHPGHGLSTGARADITDFSEYVTAMADFTAICHARLEGPLHLVAHSMGCAVATEYLLTRRDDPFEQVVFVSPLVRPAAWKASQVGMRVSGSSVDYMPRIIRRSSSNREFHSMIKNDPLQARHVSMRWVRALHTWNGRVVGYDPSDRVIGILQGTEDSVVDWEYNTVFLRDKFPQTQTTLVKGGGHHLLNEALPMRQRVLEMVTSHLANPAHSPRTARSSSSTTCPAMGE